MDNFRFSKLLRSRRPRRFHAYCVGSQKSGTHSIARAFRAEYRAAHEPQSWRLLAKIKAMAEGKAERAEIVEFIRKRDQRLGLELESSYILSDFLDVLLGEFSDARFILTIRDCFSWLNAEINHRIERRPIELWTRKDDVIAGPDRYEYAEEESPLAKRGLYNLDGYLNLWATHNETVLESVPPERLLVVRTHEISQSLPDLERFLGVPRNSLDRTKSHSFRATKDHRLLESMDAGFVESKVTARCGEIMRRYFPESCDGRGRASLAAFRRSPAAQL